MRLQILIPVASIVSTCLSLSVVWWAWQRRKERESFYRFELARLMLDRYADSPEKVLEWLQKERDGDARGRIDAIHASAWVLLIGGAAALLGLGFRHEYESLFGWVPIGVAAGLFVYLLATRRRA